MAGKIIHTDRPQAETRVYFSIWIRVFYLLLSVVSIGFGLLLILFPGKDAASAGAIWGYVLGTGIIIGMGYFGYIAIRGMRNREPQIILSESGIKTSSDQFRAWGKIKEVRIIARGNGRFRSYHLEYMVGGSWIDCELLGLDTGSSKLGQLIATYRGRYLQAKPKQNIST